MILVYLKIEPSNCAVLTMLNIVYKQIKWGYKALKCDNNY